jgi:hypothetical protein
MTHKKSDLYRGFNVFTEEIRPGIWSFSLAEVSAAELAEHPRPSARRRVPGEHPSKEAALAAARGYVDRIQQNRKNRSTQGAA